MQIGQLAMQVGVSIDTVRYYERHGLLPQPQRRASGYRHYGKQDIARLRFIRRAKDLGFSLHEIQELLHLSESSNADRAEVRSLAKRRLDDIEHKLRELEAMRATLTKLVGLCSGRGALQGCPIIETLVEPEPSP